MADYQIQVENHGEKTGLLNNPFGTFTMQIPGETTVTKPIPLNQLLNMQGQVTSLELKELPDENPAFTVTLLDPQDSTVTFGDLPRDQAGPGIFIPLDQG